MDAARHDLLCENCGYHLLGLAPDDRCPECAQGVADSLPARRPGSPFQRRASPLSWAATNLLVLVAPGRTMRRLRLDHRYRLFLGVNLLIAGVVLVDPWVGVLTIDPFRGRWREGASGAAIHIGWQFVLGALAALVMLALTAIEVAGVRFFAARRGWRVTRRAAWQVCSHASVGWILAGVLPIAGGALNAAITHLTRARSWGVADLGVLGTRSWREVLMVALGGGGILAGLLVFETLVWAGVRRCRFANEPGAGELGPGPPRASEAGVGKLAPGEPTGPGGI